MYKLFRKEKTVSLIEIVTHLSLPQFQGVPFPWYNFPSRKIFTASVRSVNGAGDPGHGQFPAPYPARIDHVCRRASGQTTVAGKSGYQTQPGMCPYRVVTSAMYIAYYKKKVAF